jgi:hypothetical protein
VPRRAAARQAHAPSPATRARATLSPFLSLGTQRTVDVVLDLGQAHNGRADLLLRNGLDGARHAELDLDAAVGVLLEDLGGHEALLLVGDPRPLLGRVGNHGKLRAALLLVDDFLGAARHLRARARRREGVARARGR